MEYSPTSLFWGIANSCVGFISDMSLKSRVGSFGNCELKVRTLDKSEGYRKATHQQNIGGRVAGRSGF